MQDIGKLALMSAGAGAAGRGLMGLYNVLKRNVVDPKPTQHLAVMPLPIPEEEEKRGGVMDLLRNPGATSVEGLPYYYPAMAMGGLAGGYGGWKVIDTILNARRKQDVNADVEQARGDFQQALLGQYDDREEGQGKTQAIPKAAADEGMLKLGEDLDRLFDLLEKQAGLLDSLTPSADTLGRAAGLYGTYALPTALLAGYAAFKAGEKHTRRAVLEKALKQRAARRQAMQPAEIYAMPVRQGVKDVPVMAGADDE
jgi:hypothetical protein